VDEFRPVPDIHAGGRQRRIILRNESAEILGILFDAPVSPEKIEIEIDANLRHQSHSVLPCCGNLHGGDQILLPVGAQGTNGQLRSGEDNRLVKIHKHVTQRRGGICHGVGAVKNDKPVKMVVILFDGQGNSLPDFRRHV